ncbi:HU family DNA-binding protein [Lysinibacillus xylanilyticus]|uniref:HU family DNA-binding protein n=1 Tax=Lysinibacillus xylanilyticus TaxID=582475 RepID=UPI0038258BF1
MTNKLPRTQFIKNYLTQELETNLPTVRVSKALAKEILNGDADSVEVRVTSDFAIATLDSVENAYAKAIVAEQANIGFGGLGQFKVEVKAEREYHNPQDTSKKILKPEHLSAKFALSKGFKDTLAQTAIN